MTIKTEITTAPPVVDPATDNPTEELDASYSATKFETVELEDPDPAKDIVVSTSEDEVWEWPDVFYCQRTHTLMNDPVVGPDGNSLERSKIDEEEDTSTYYSNRALKTIMQETISMRGDSLRASLKHFQHSVSQGLSHLMPETTANEPLFRPLNDAFYCPITFNLMHQPVIDPEGNTFEKVAVENWIRINQNSPITRAALQISQLYPNTAIQRLLDQEKAKPEEQMHPSVRKWRDERPPLETDIELGGGQVLEQERQQNQGANASPTFIVVTTVNGHGTVPYPTTPSEWEQREQARRRSMYHFFGLIFAFVCLTGFVLTEAFSFYFFS